MARVYIPNKSLHDFSGVSSFGEPVFVTEGLVDRYGVNQIARHCVAALKDAEEDDLILISSLPVITAVLSGLFTLRFGRLNLLLYRPASDDGRVPEEYVKRTVVFDQ